MELIPSVFVGHGAPTIAIDNSPAHTFLSGLGVLIPAPKAVLCISAHWETREPTVSLATEPQTIYDFYGFPDELYSMQYPAAGSPTLARRVSELLSSSGIPCHFSEDRGLDHGAWIPLSLAYPGADIPVVQLSLAHSYSPAEQYGVGRALSTLRSEGVLILGSGNATHNLREFGPYAETPNAEPPVWVKEFDSWLEDRVLGLKTEDLLNYRQRAPHAERNHPTEEHFMPLFVAMGAAGDEFTARQLHHSFSYGILSMASYAFG